MKDWRNLLEMKYIRMKDGIFETDWNELVKMNNFPYVAHRGNNSFLIYKNDLITL